MTELCYPQNQSTNIPIGSSLYLVFDKEVDLESIRSSVILFGNDSDRTVMPDNALWINEKQGENKDFLKSPGYKGFCEFDVDIKYLDPQTLEVIDVNNDFDRTLYYCGVIITPKITFAVNTEYTLYIIGANTQSLDPIYQTNKAVSLRTIYSPKLIETLDPRIKIRGTYKGKELNGNNLNIQIVSSGNGNVAQYVYWFDDQNIDMSKVSRCSGRWRSIDKGLVIKFDDTQYTEGEIITIKCYPVDLLQDSYIVKFTTNDGSIFIEPEPDYRSTSPINTVVQVDPNDKLLSIISITPASGEVNVPIESNRIVITFNKNIDPATITQDTIKLQALPVSGFYDDGRDKKREYKLYKILSVEDNKVIIEF